MIKVKIKIRCYDESDIVDHLKELANAIKYEGISKMSIQLKNLNKEDTGKGSRTVKIKV